MQACVTSMFSGSRYRGLAAETVSGHHSLASRLLSWLGERAASATLGHLTIKDVDSFVDAQPAI